MLRVQITKRPDGSGVLRCTRSDGSVTWQKQRQGVFFAHHDLTHFAVETTLGYTRGFYGLIATGWDIAETTGKGERGPLPDEALEVEHLVGALDVERSGSTYWTVEEFNHHLVQVAASSRTSRELTEEDLVRVRSKRAELFAQWTSLPFGETLELEFPHAGVARR